jgi:hypothetical protein
MPNVIDLYSPWQVASDASDRVAELITDIPGWRAYRHAPETLGELRQAAELLERAARLLERAGIREAERQEADHA